MTTTATKPAAYRYLTAFGWKLSPDCPPFESEPLYTESQILAATKPLEAENQRLRMALADTEALEIGTGERCEQLRQQLAAANAEIERLKSENETHWSNGADFTNHIIKLEQQLAASQLREQQYREALESIAANTCCDRCQEAALVARNALALHTDTTALEAIVKKAGECMRERCAAAFDQPHVEWFGDQIDEEIRALPGVNIGDLK